MRIFNSHDKPIGLKEGLDFDSAQFQLYFLLVKHTDCATTQVVEIIMINTYIPYIHIGKVHIKL